VKLRADVGDVRVGRCPPGDAHGRVATRDLHEDEIGDGADRDEYEKRSDQPAYEKRGHLVLHLDGGGCVACIADERLCAGVSVHVTASLATIWVTGPARRDR
jgi:hypothetical protein